MRRFPNGVDDKSFFEKRCPSHRPDWVGTCARARRPRRRDRLLPARPTCRRSCGPPTSPRSRLHAPMARCGDIETPTMVVFDLDPGAPAAMTECAEVGAVDPRRARRPRARVLRQDVGLEGLAGVRAAERPAAHPRAGVVVRARGGAGDGEAPRRRGAVEHEQGSCARARCSSTGARTRATRRRSAPYSLRARPHPTVSTPVDVGRGRRGGRRRAPLSFEAAEVLDRGRRARRPLGADRDLVQEIPLP